MPPKRNPGPFLSSFYISDAEIERTAHDRLVALGLMPDSPAAVAVERYCELRWRFTEDYRDLPPGVLGCAAFSESGIKGIGISRTLAEDSSRIGVVRTRSTLAHEIGHGELHSAAYAAKLRYDREQGERFGATPDETANILCREDQINRPRREEWWEIQANQFMVALLMPPHLLRKVVEGWMPPGNDYRPPPCPLEDRIASIFEVGKQMARIAGDKVLAQIQEERARVKSCQEPE
jgi:hypothetical protein